VVLVLFAKVILPPLAPSWFPDLGVTVVNAVCFTGVWVVLRRWGQLRVSGVAALGGLRRWWLVLPMLAVACSYPCQASRDVRPLLVSGLVSLLWVSINEEVYSRGLVQQVLTPLGPMRPRSASVSCRHRPLPELPVLRRPVGRHPVADAVRRPVRLHLRGLRYAIGSVWPMAAVHGLDDFFQIRSPGAAPDWWQGCVYAFHAAYGVWRLRHYGAGDALLEQGVARTNPDGRPEQAGALD
jgi:hypothetical protein